LIGGDEVSDSSGVVSWWTADGIGSALLTLMDRIVVPALVRINFLWKTLDLPNE